MNFGTLLIRPRHEYSFFSWLDNPSMSGNSLWGSSISHIYTPVGRTFLDEWSTHLRDLYLTTDRDPWPGAIRTRNPIKWAAADPRLRQRCQWDRPVHSCRCKILFWTVYESFLLEYENCFWKSLDDYTVVEIHIKQEQDSATEVA